MNVVVREFEFTGDSETLFTLLFKEASDAFWLDGNRIMEGLSRYSFMGMHARFSVSLEKGVVSIVHPHASETIMDDPFEVLQQLLNQYHVPPTLFPHLPFIGGFVGYFGFEMLQYVEKIPVHSNPLNNIPEGYWLFYDQVLVLDQVDKKAYLTRLYEDHEWNENIEKELCDQIARIQKIAEMKPGLRNHGNLLPSTSFKQTEDVRSYTQKIRDIKEYVAKGDIYQACFTYCLTARLQSSPYLVYQVLRHINPAPFSSYLKFNHLEILSSSPERFLRLDLNRKVESRPIKGTRPRGESKKADVTLRLELQQSEKDRVENVMIVDLVRNDLGRVCKNIRVPRLLHVESYATVHQLVSIVQGELKSSKCSMDVIRAAFPGGSMTGAPKVRALEILHTLEPVARGIYSGGLGYLDVRGSFDLSMVIRTIICIGNEATFHVGGGIVADSDPEEEYQESLDKAYALKVAIAIAERLAKQDI